MSSRTVQIPRSTEWAEDTPLDGRLAGVVLLRDDGAALLQHRDDKPGLSHAGMWVMPGGHCDPRESAEQCARRELREETDYKCDGLDWLISFVNRGTTARPNGRLTFFWARYDSAQAVRCLEGQAMEFVPWQQATFLRTPPYLLEVWDLAITASHRDKD